MQQPYQHQSDAILLPATGQRIGHMLCSNLHSLLSGLEEVFSGITLGTQHRRMRQDVVHEAIYVRCYTNETSDFPGICR